MRGGASLIPRQYDAFGASCVFATLWAMARKAPDLVGAALERVAASREADHGRPMQGRYRWVFTHSHDKAGTPHAIRLEVLDVHRVVYFYWNPPNPIRIAGGGGTMEVADICRLFPLLPPEVTGSATLGATERITVHDKQVAFRCVARYMSMAEIRLCARTECRFIVRGVLSDTVWHPYVTQLLNLGARMGELGVRHVPRYDALPKHTQWAQYLFLGQTGPLSANGIEWAADPDNEDVIKTWLMGAHLHESMAKSGPLAIRVTRGAPEKLVIAGKKRTFRSVGPMELERESVETKRRRPRAYGRRRRQNDAFATKKHVACIAITVDGICALYVTPLGSLMTRKMIGYAQSSPELASAPHARQAIRAVDDWKNLARDV